MKTNILTTVLALGLAFTFTLRAPAASPVETKSVASDAYIYGYAMLYNYKTMFQQAVDPSFPGYIGGFGRFRHYSRGFTPADADIVTPSNDTPYSWAWLDLRTEPWVVSVPAIDRYYVLQWFDLYTHNFAYLGSRHGQRRGELSLRRAWLEWRRAQGHHQGHPSGDGFHRHAHAHQLDRAGGDRGVEGDPGAIPPDAAQ